MIDPEFLKMLACPACDERPPVALDEKNAKLICGKCGRKYPIKDGIPVMLVEEAER